MTKTDAVLVTYNPDIDILVQCIESLSSQVRTIWLVDNSSTTCNFKSSFEHLPDEIEIIKLMGNTGIAYAQNIGIEKAIENEADFILLSDQDTFFPDNYVANMLSVFGGGTTKIAAVAPLFHDAIGDNDNECFIVNSRFGFSKIFPNEGHHNIFQAIASGFIIKSSTLRVIGLMEEDLFIDWVDLEWCWRAIHMGYFIVGNADVVIEHRLGDRSINLGSRGINLRAPSRHYYITRNAFYLATRCKYLDIWHRINICFKGFGYLFGYTFLAKPRYENFKMTLLGFYHGLKGQLGRLD